MPSQGEGGGGFCDSVWQGGEGLRSDQICVTPFLNGPKTRRGAINFLWGGRRGYLPKKGRGPLF